MSDSSQTKVLVATGAAVSAVALAAGLYYYYSKDSGDEAAGKLGSFKPHQITADQVHKLLCDVLESQEKMKQTMKTLSKDVLEKDLKFAGLYERAKELKPVDPVDEAGLSMADFDRLLDRHRDEPKVREKIVAIMGQSFTSQTAEAPSKLTVKKVIEVHTFMLQRMKELQKEIAALSGGAGGAVFDKRITTIVVQALIGAGVQRQFNSSSEDVEAAVFQHRNELTQNQQFATINLEMRRAMEALTGASD